MKVLITTPYYLPNISGITVYIKILSEEMVKSGHEILILTSKHDKFSLNSEVINGVVIKRMWSPIRISKGIIPIFLLFQAIKNIRKYDVVNCHLPQFEAIVYVIIAKIFGKKVILTNHTDLSFWKGISNRIIDLTVFVSQSISAKLSDKIITYTNDYAINSYFLKNYLKKTIEIYPPIKFETKTKSDFKIDRNKKYIIGFCGRVARQKGLELLIEACKVLDKKLGANNYLIWIAGPKKVIGENYYKYFTNKYKNRIKNNFVFFDSIERDNLAKFYKTIDLLVLPSNDTLESFGWVQIEAMMCGTPCVATDLSGMRVPIIESEGGKLFENNNATDLANKIETVLINGKTYYKNKIDKNLYKFDYKKSIIKFEDLINKI